MPCKGIHKSALALPYSPVAYFFTLQTIEENALVVILYFKNNLFPISFFKIPIGNSKKMCKRYNLYISISTLNY